MSKQVKLILAVVLLVAAAVLIAMNVFKSSGPDPRTVPPPPEGSADAPSKNVGGARMAPGGK